MKHTITEVSLDIMLIIGLLVIGVALDLAIVGRCRKEAPNIQATITPLRSSPKYVIRGDGDVLEGDGYYDVLPAPWWATVDVRCPLNMRTVYPSPLEVEEATHKDSASDESMNWEFHHITCQSDGLSK